MAIPTFNHDMDIIGKIPEHPADAGYTTESFRAEFDTAGKLLKEYVNTVLIPELDKTVDVNALISAILDPSLTREDKAARADIVGEALTKLESAIDTLSGNVKNAFAKSRSVTLSAGGWNSGKQTVTCADVTTGNHIVVSPAPASWDAYLEAGILCIEQGNQQLTFSSEDTPLVNLTVNILIHNEGGVT